MPRIQTLTHPSKRTWFEYDGGTTSGVTLRHKVSVPIDARLFKAALERFAGQTVTGGFSMTNPPSDGFGTWVAQHSKTHTGRILTTRHASFIAAILVRDVVFRIHQDTLRRARLRALEEGTSLDAVVEEFLASWSAGAEATARRQFVALGREHDLEGGLDGRDWARDVLYEERTRWPRS